MANNTQSENPPEILLSRRTGADKAMHLRVKNTQKYFLILFVSRNSWFYFLPIQSIKYRHSYYTYKWIYMYIGIYPYIPIYTYIYKDLYVFEWSSKENLFMLSKILASTSNIKISFI